ncbi:DUF460 domain-containing protein [Geoglobus acetivorans]|uniref:Rhodanese domain-containing protein n=1 Tax=Geoglobus acetivorans TaxID=565033 RepID=A0A0A7GD40_GEOAI|nr:hypothetical protein GACE_0702 [Geoglobus acetivorans]
MKIIGVDIIRGSATAKSRYAAYFISDGSEWSKDVSKHRLLKYIKEIRPDIVAVDNIFELFESKRELVSFLKSIPPTTKIVQTAGKQSLPALAKRYGIRIDPKNPFDEAKASALLAKYGVGEIVSVFTDKTVIKVSRNRSLGKGGWRQNKYRRKVHDSVRAVFREIKKILDEKGLEYVEEIRRGYGGISRGIFIVNSPRESVPINSFRLRDVQVNVSAVEKEKIEFIPMKKHTKYTIVGIDPGTTVGVAVLDLNGHVISVKSKKGWSYSEVTEFILSHGKPVIIATDKKNAPEYVQKMRASFNCTLYTPKEDLPVEKKKVLTSLYQPFNDHERDALASAIDAFNAYKNKFRNIEKRIPEGFDFEEIKAGIIKGMSLKSLIEKSELQEQSKERAEPRFNLEEIKKRDRLIAELREENRRLSTQIRELKKEIERLQDRIHKIASEEYRKVRELNHIKSLEGEIKTLKKVIADKDRTIRELENKIEELRSIKYLEFRGWKAIKTLRKFTREEIEKLISTIGLDEGEVVYISDAGGGGKSAAELLVNRKIKAVLFSGEMSHYAKEVFDRSKIPIIDLERLETKQFEDFILVRADRLDEEVQNAIEEIEKRTLNRLEEMILDYRNRRKMF